MATAGIDGRQLRWERHKDDRRRLIVEAGLAVMASEGAGAEVRIQQIADRAAINRSAIHRLFASREELDAALQAAIAARVADVVLDSIVLDVPPREVVRRVVHAFVEWALEHPAWLHFVAKPIATADEAPLALALGTLTERLVVVVGGILEALGAELAPDDADFVDPWLFGAVSAGLQSVQRWMARTPRRPGTRAFVVSLSDAFWFQADGLARERGVELPEGPLDAALGGAPATDH
ncbi:TetR/AcrR family transcriptional regulator [Nocardioides ultimimeridianus]